MKGKAPVDFKNFDKPIKLKKQKHRDNQDLYNLYNPPSTFVKQSSAQDACY